MIDAASLCIADIETVLQSIAKLKGKVLQVYSEDELLDKTKPIAFPAAGVTYEGMRAVGEAGSTHKVGISAEVVLSIILVETFSNVSSANTKKLSPPILDAIREGMMARRSPTGHFWKFIVEAAAKPANGTVLWVSRWSTPVQLVPTPAR